ncbi:MAG TPA: helix-turn-helix transcriptional regulator [Longimicrobium sp.]|jgi:HTH-type transcriptional regulator/antitoxin HipB|nr:helix-turn-helix transcriptional regulator [Longimicrobium sp.]
MRLRTVREVGLLARTERKRQGLSMQAVADRVGCSRQWIAALEAGGERLEVALVLRTLAALGVRLDAQVSEGGRDTAA